MPFSSVEQKREYQRNWCQKQRLEFFTDKSCVMCGSSDNLELDHIDPDEKVSHRIWSFSLKRRDEELTKCQVLCNTCHKTKTKKFLSELFTKPVQHGSRYAYKHHGCRCELCSNFYTTYRRNKYLRTGT